ncbi:hypothetical protein R2360_16600 [Mycobacteroides chelonae]|uniref:Uncharacterized protein n=1 Tax=Mycobacteroides chelonae TaxID=1774 RepID=A0AB73U4P2_MYCCH|nr:hypothetical protein [Mycobacteroides chelonae]MEC4841066.1 hypothetical protein [Mycobacteroides chelonae]MEC4842803.1 hypothetical protein [Mycobacteroides chelonae]QDF71785.1 hypothetical protein FJK96_17580 [Mycobacteroides chelonae]WED92131.1 hypothetical protein PXJ67_01000 [Mycobacteroides chelonae]WED95649.1 hypothetical protein PYW02_17455 [Mycobacteroides chelonae]
MDIEGAEAGASPVWMAPREYRLGAAQWMTRAVHHLSRALHPILGEMGHMVVDDLPEVEEPVRLSKRND